MEEGNIFPDEILLDILNNLSTEELMRVCITSKYNNILCKDEILWQNLYFDNFGLHEKTLSNKSWYDNYIYVRRLFSREKLNIIKLYKNNVYNWGYRIQRILHDGNYRNNGVRTAIYKLGMVIKNTGDTNFLFVLEKKGKIYIIAQIGDDMPKIMTDYTILVSRIDDLDNNGFYKTTYDGSNYTFITFTLEQINFLLENQYKLFPIKH
ncbi:F-box domain-containing protein [Orpheovirus IHUMI-LCC2]|uniref:F-box domain-containing protein n=1 Tax=Orpheovirus IHUMI-LCC2 TaxID=2023057 RepID=A0A2I2L504_9VIRU|nr:F-box domain-containing protein [Orpheovirus IHUMI-LCC2]SNW62635.1 F-box domain-containing protein [Orpheovirus IHUMI-LCC2]